MNFSALIKAMEDKGFKLEKSEGNICCFKNEELLEEITKKFAELEFTTESRIQIKESELKIVVKMDPSN